MYNIEELSYDYDENKIDDILENITLIHLKKPFTQFYTCEFEKLKKAGLTINIKNLMKDLSASWAKLEESEKNKYIKLYENDKKDFIKSIEILRHFLFKDYNGLIRRPATPYQIFLNQKLIEGLDKSLDPKIIKKNASCEWKIMEKEQKKLYIERKIDNDNWFEKAKNIRKVSAISIFIQKQISLSKNKKQEFPKLGEISKKWKTLEYYEKTIYAKYAKEINEEREKLQDIYEFINGIKPKRPAGAFRIFLQEKAKENTLKDIKDGKELWDRLTDSKKEEYLKKSHRLILAYRYKKMIYEKKIKKILPKKPLNAFNLFLKDKKEQKIPNGQDTMAYWRTYFDNLPKYIKEKYEKKEKIEKETYEKKMEKFKNAVFDMPKKPLLPFTLFVQEVIPKLKNKIGYKNLSCSELVKKAAEMWSKCEPEVREIFEENTEEDIKRYKEENNEFKKFGYYIKKDLSDKFEQENEETITKRKITKKRSESINNVKKRYKRTKSPRKNNKSSSNKKE